jgi:hypothetical protein
MDDENTAFAPLIGIKNPLSFVLIRPEPEVLPLSAHLRLICRVLAAPNY